MITTWTAAAPLAGNDFGDTQSDGVAGPMGLLIILLLAIVTVFLIRNMNARIKRLPATFDHADADADASAGKVIDDVDKD